MASENRTHICGSHFLCTGQCWLKSSSRYLYQFNLPPVTCKKAPVFLLTHGTVTPYSCRVCCEANLCGMIFHLSHYLWGWESYTCLFWFPHWCLLTVLLLGCYFLIDVRISLCSSRVCLKSIFFFMVSFDI